MTNLFGTNDVVAKLSDEDISLKWVIIKPEVMNEIWKKEYQTKENQVIRAHGGFGCRAGSLSMRGGKTFATDINGYDTTVYRNEILGIAKHHVLKELGIAE